MGQNHSQLAEKATSSPLRAVQPSDFEHRETATRFSEPDYPRHVVKPKDFVQRDPDTALRRMLPMAHQKICQLPIRIDAVCVKMITFSHTDGPDGGLASCIRDLCETMKRIYRYLCSPKRAPESLLPFSGPDLAEAIGILALKLERWVRDFEGLCPHKHSRIQEVAGNGTELADKCEQTRAVLESIKKDKCLQMRPKRSTDAYLGPGLSAGSFRSRSGWSTSSSQPGMGRSIFGV